MSHKPVDVPAASTSTTPATNTTSASSSVTINENRSTESTTTTTTDSATSNTKPINDTNKIQKQAEFRRQFAEILGDSSNAQTDKV